MSVMGCFLSIIASIVIFVAGLFGFNNVTDIVQNFKDDITYRIYGDYDNYNEDVTTDEPETVYYEDVESEDWLYSEPANSGFSVNN